MLSNTSVLNSEERDVLILGAMHLDDKQLSNTEIAERLFISVSRVKTIIHQACVKLRAHNRNEAILCALKRGEIGINELFSLEELADRFSSLGPDQMRRIAHLVRQGLEHGYIPVPDESFVRMDKRQDTLLTKAERDTVVLAGCGLTNREIAEKLYISTSAVRTFLYRACAKLGAQRRADAVSLAVRRKEISAIDIFTSEEFMQILAPLGADYIEKLALLMDQQD